MGTIDDWTVATVVATADATVVKTAVLTIIATAVATTVATTVETAFAATATATAVATAVSTVVPMAYDYDTRLRLAFSSATLIRLFEDTMNDERYDWHELLFNYVKVETE